MTGTPSMSAASGSETMVSVSGSTSLLQGKALTRTTVVRVGTHASSGMPTPPGYHRGGRTRRPVECRRTSLDRPDAGRALSHRRADRSRRDVDGLPRDRHPARSPRRDQGDGPEVRRRPAVPEPLRVRGARGGQAQASRRWSRCTTRASTANTRS